MHSQSSIVALETTFRNIHRQLKPRTPLPAIEASFYPSVAANHSAVLDKGRLTLKISDLFNDAPADVLEALAVILLSRLYRRKVAPVYRERYRMYTLSPEMLRRSSETRKIRRRHRTWPGPRGHTYDLEQLFSEINAEYFNSALPKPRISWSQRSARSTLGRYEFDEDTIVISRYLDSPRVPNYVVEYILFHEMLHVKFGSRIEGIREVVHPPEFREAEKLFRHFHEATAWLTEN